MATRIEGGRTTSTTNNRGGTPATSYGVDEYGRQVQQANDASSVWSGVSQAVGKIPIIGGILSPLIRTVASKADRDSAYATQKMEMAYNSEEAQKNRDWQTSEREAVQQFDMDMWNMNNEYNSLSSQLDRAKEAGVNPNDVVGSGGSSIASSPVSSSAGNGSAASYSSGMAVAQMQQAAQLALMRAQTDNLDSKTRETDYNTKFNKKIENQRIEELEKKIQESQGRFDKLMSDIGVNDVDKEVKRGMFQIAMDKSVQELDILKETLNKLRNDNLLVIEQIGKAKAETASEEVRKALLEVQKAFSDATGVPIGTTQFDIFFKAFTAGNVNDLIDYYKMFAAYESPKLLAEAIESALSLFGSAKRFKNFIGPKKTLTTPGESPMTSPMPSWTINPTF